jgi:hypothetical protein
MKIIFLDIDGVMNSESYYKTINTKQKIWSRFNPVSVNIVTKLVQEFDARIVISSLWRFAMKKELSKELNSNGLINFLHNDWSTPVIKPSHRGKEIKLWLDLHPEIRDFLIFDDDEDILSEHYNRFIKTTLADGLQEEHYYKAREILEQYGAS